MATNYPETFSHEPDRLLAGPRQHFRVVGAQLASGQNLSRGALLTSSDGVTVTQVSAATDAVFGILAGDADASSAAVPVQVYVAGDFNKSLVDVGSLTVDSFILSARNVGILFREEV